VSYTWFNYRLFSHHDDSSCEHQVEDTDAKKRQTAADRILLARLDGQCDMLKAVMGGRGGDLIDLARTNLWQ